MSRAACSGRLGVAIVAVLVVGLGLGLVVVPWARRDREFFASIQQPAPLFNTPVVTVGPGHSACVSNATILPESEVARFRVGTRGGPAVPMRLTVAADGYRYVTRIPATWKDNDVVSVPLRPPDRGAVGSFCFDNLGRTPVDFYAADDRTRTESRTFVDDRLVSANIQLQTYEARPASVLSHLGSILDELTVFRPGFVGLWLLWPLAILVALGVPVLALGAVYRAVREDELSDPPDRR